MSRAATPAFRRHRAASRLGNGSGRQHVLPLGSDVDRRLPSAAMARPGARRYRAGMRRVASLVLALAVAACGGAQKRPDPAVEARIAALESQVAALQAPAATSASAEPALEQRVATLEERMTTLAARAERPTRPSRPQPDPAKVYAIPVGNSPVEGPAAAKITIVMAGEYACPFCEKVRATLTELRAMYGAELRIVHKSFIVHPQVATTPALAACAAHKQGKWSALDDRLWARAFAERRFDEDFMLVLAREAKLDLKRFKRDLAGDACKAEIGAEQAQLAAVGVGATPAFFINGRFLSGAQPVAAFSAVIDEEYTKANAAIKSGVAAKDYYDTVVKSGLTKLE
jgi:protein-disulfide isomerase